jgi:hypothetical protein
MQTFQGANLQYTHLSSFFFLFSIHEPLHVRTSQAVNFGMPLETTYLDIEHKCLLSDLLTANRGIATGRGVGWGFPHFSSGPIL